MKNNSQVIEIFGTVYREYFDPITKDAFLCNGSQIVAETKTGNGLREVWFYAGDIEQVKAWARTFKIERLVMSCN